MHSSTFVCFAKKNNLHNAKNQCIGQYNVIQPKIHKGICKHVPCLAARRGASVAYKIITVKQRTSNMTAWARVDSQ